MRHPRAYRYAGKLLHYPSTTVGLECPVCLHRRGRYSLARLAHRYGPDIPLDDLFDALVRCPRHRTASDRPPAKYGMRCAARFAEWTG